MSFHILLQIVPSKCGVFVYFCAIKAFVWSAVTSILQACNATDSCFIRKVTQSWLSANDSLFLQTYVVPTVQMAELPRASVTLRYAVKLQQSQEQEA